MWQIYVYLSCIKAHEIFAIFVSDTYLAITCEVNIAVACVLVHICKNVGSICQFSIVVA